MGKLRPCDRETEKVFDMPFPGLDASDELSPNHPEELCPACRLFGTTSYKGRVRFGFANLVNKPNWFVEKLKLLLMKVLFQFANLVNKPNWFVEREHGSDGFLTLPLLEKPRPTWSMPNKDCNVPGRKFYIHHNYGGEYVKKKQHEIVKSENNKSVESLAGGNEFSFTVYFENLEAWELGLFLYSLELEPENNLTHKMGMAKAHGFGSVQIEIEGVALRNTTGDWVDESKKKNDWLDKGYQQLESWFGNGKVLWYKITHIKNLRKLLKYDNESKKVVEYPKLKGEGELPGYDKLSKWPYKERVACLTTPWSPWHPHAIPKDDKQESKSEIKDTITPGNSIVHKEDQRKPTPKSKIPLTNKYSGIIKSFEKNGEIVVAKENGGDVQGRYYEKTLIKVGQKIKFRVEQGGMFTKIYDVEIVR